MKSVKYITALLIIGFAIYHVWFLPKSFFFGDWGFSFKESLTSFSHPSVSGPFGIEWLWKYPYLLLQGTIGYLGFNSDVADKLLVFWQISLLTPLVGFLFVKKITSSNIAAFIGSLIFSYNTYFLSIDTQGHELLTVAFTWALLAFTSIIYLLETKKKIFILLSSLLFFITGFYDLRSMYVLAGIVTLYFIYYQIFVENWKDNLRKNSVNFLSFVFILILLSAYYLIPMVLTRALTNNEFSIRQVFGSEFYNLQNSITFFYPFWTGKETTWLQLEQIPIYFWLYPLFAFAGLIVSNKNKKILFFGLLAIIGIFLTKQESSPFPYIYTWLYTHIPGFNAFREASKFDFITAVSYSVLIGVFADFVFNYAKSRKIKYSLLILFAVFPLINAIPVFTGDIKSMFVPKTVPSDFIKLNNYINSDKSYSKILGIDLNIYYNFSTNIHPEIDLYYSLDHYWGFDLLTYNFRDQTKTGAEKTVEYLNSDEGRRLLQQSSIGYVIIFVADKQSNQNLRRETGKNRYYYEKEFQKIPYLQKVDLGLQNIIVYKDTDFKPHLYLTSEKESLKKDIPFQKVDYTMINNSQYHINFKNVSKPFYLNFSELYSNQWVIHVGKFNWWKTLLNKSYFLSDKIQSQSDVRFNEFYIDPKQVCKTNICKINKDGTFDFEATIYVRAQSYLYLGLIISAVTLILTIGSVIFMSTKRK